MGGDGQWTLADHIAKRQGWERPHTPSVAEAIEIAGLQFGDPGICGTCGEPGLVDYVDIETRQAWVSCKWCGPRQPARLVANAE